MYVKVVPDNAPAFLHWIFVWSTIGLETCFKRAQSIKNSLEPSRGINSKLYNVIEGAYDIPVCFDRIGRLFGEVSQCEFLESFMLITVWLSMRNTRSWNIFGEIQESHLREFKYHVNFAFGYWDYSISHFCGVRKFNSWTLIAKQHYRRRLDID